MAIRCLAQELITAHRQHIDMMVELIKEETQPLSWRVGGTLAALAPYHPPFIAPRMTQHCPPQPPLLPCSPRPNFPSWWWAKTT